jgi:ankyrin repeat protein
MGAAASRKKAWNAFLQTVSEQERREWEVLLRFYPITALRLEGRTEFGFKPIHFSVIIKNTPLLKALLAIGADPNAWDVSQVTPLMQALYSDDMDALRILLDAGADINAQDDEGFTALAHVGDRHDRKRIRFLLDAGADPTIRDNAGLTAGERYPFIDEVVSQKKAEDEASALAEKHGISHGGRSDRGGAL